MKNSRVLRWEDDLTAELSSVIISHFKNNPIEKAVFMEYVHKAELIPVWAENAFGYYEQVYARYLAACHETGKKLEIKMNS